jgi:ankyrin repeat protein
MSGGGDHVTEDDENCEKLNKLMKSDI